MQAISHRELCLKDLQGDLPMELLVDAFQSLENSGRDTRNILQWLSFRGVEIPRVAQVPYDRRTNNQKSAEIERLIREYLEKGWSKSAISKALDVNRRVVIRVALEAIKSAQVQVADSGLHTDGRGE